MGQLSRFVQLSVWIYLIYSTHGNSDNITINENTADGDTLVNLGKHMGKPLLTLIGLAIRNQHPCSEWGQWTSCTARLSRFFGTKKRTRICSSYKTPGETALSKLEEDISVCVGSCPTDYTLTVNGYCLKFYGLRKNWNETDKICRNDGGHLVFIGDDAKFSEVKKVLEGVGNYYIWIAGRRNDTSSPWVTRSGDKMTKFYWMSGQPKNRPNDTCIVLDLGTTRQWHDTQCNENHLAFCEITA